MGDDLFAPNADFVQECVQVLAADNTNDGTCTSYALDVGVLESGDTSVVEWNDGFALASYGLDANIYTNLLLARWNKVVSQRPT
jgi:hypothetical protein